MTVFQVTEIKTKTFYELIIILKYNQVTHCSLLQKKKKRKEEKNSRCKRPSRKHGRACREDCVLEEGD